MCADPSHAAVAAPLRLGIVGCGAIVREGHLPVLRGEPQADVRVLCDKNVRSAAAAGKQFGLAAAVTDRAEDLAGKVDAAIVAVPPRFHAPVAIGLMEAGIDVLCEKPLAATAADAERMVATAARTGRLLAVGLVTRFHRSNHVLRTLLRGGVVGEVREVVAEQGAPLDWTMTSASYYSRDNTAGGVFFDAGVHLIDRLVWLFGDLRVTGYEDDSYGGVESNAALAATATLGGREVPVRVALSWTHFLANCIKVVGTEATAKVRLDEPDAVVVTREVAGEPLAKSVTAQRPPFAAAGGDPFRAQLLDFFEAVRLRREPFVAGASAVGALRVIERAYAVRKRMAQPWVEPEVTDDPQ